MAKKPTPEPLIPASAISADEAAYLNTLIAQRKQSDATLQTFAAYLAQKYRISEGDGLRPDGTIQRKAPG